MDHIQLRRPDNSHLELAEQIAQYASIIISGLRVMQPADRFHSLYNDGPQPLHHVCPIPPKGGPGSLCFLGPVSQSVGYLRTSEKALSPYIDDFRGSNVENRRQSGRHVWQHRRCCQICARGSRSRCQLGRLSPDSTFDSVCWRRPTCEVMANEW